MRKFLITAAAMTAISAGSASAADIAARPYTKAPLAVVDVYNWTGFYVGGNVGGVWTSSKNGWVLDPAHPVDAAGAISARQILTSNKLDPSGFAGGVQAGYNWQTSNWVLGVEADWVWADAKKSLFQPTLAPLFGAPGDGNNLTQSFGLDWLATVRGRVGVTYDRALIYATGGLAIAGVKTFDSSHYAAGVTQTADTSETRTGWTVGGGIEYALSNNWTIKGEYLYADLGTYQTYSTLVPAFNLAYFHNHDITVQSARFGVNYKFGGPIVAKY